MNKADFTTYLSSLAQPALAFAAPLVVALVFSLFSSPGIRGWRNLGILGCYLVLVGCFFAFGWRRTLGAWLVYGLMSGMLYFAYELVTHRRSTDPDQPKPTLFTIVNGLFLWPIMAPEAVEYSLAELGVLGSAPESTIDGSTSGGPASDAGAAHEEPERRDEKHPGQP